MGKFSKLGAAALAIALSLTTLAPISANAAGYPTVDIELSTTKTNQTFDDALITENNTVIYSTTDRNAFTVEWDKYKNLQGYSRDSSSTDGKNYTYYIIQKTYKNEITGAVGLSKADVSPNSQYTEEKTLTKEVYVVAGEPTILNVELMNGDTAIKKVKSSKKKVVTAALDKKHKSVTITSSHPQIYSDNTGYYYRKSTGEKVYIPKSASGYSYDKESAEYKNSNASSASIGILLNPKKAGTSKVSFSIYNKDGQQTARVSVKVIVRSDNDVFKTLSFGGKSLIQKKYGNSDYINYGKRTSAYDLNVTTKAKGKLIVKPNKGYKIVKIQVGTYTKPTKIGGYSYDVYTNTYHNSQSEYSSKTRSGKGYFTHHDRNKDGDYLDKVYGSYESEVGMKYQTVKSGKTIKLGQYAYNADSVTTASTSTYTSGGGCGCDSTPVTTTTEASTTTRSSYDQYAKTNILITYYDQRSRAYRVTTYSLYRPVKGKKK
ncbi:hypothetical protein [Butyrivibrio sp. VCD2006]|uniref:hypothetical protein n=1 Tax=Butyrivibrio sp. VCD2006 TaxID=1280664 RepID=UPI00047958AE|nr:hypothetical protein [Butyrivibrio sp. VCD2006]